MAIGISFANYRPRDLRRAVSLVAPLGALALSIASCGGGSSSATETAPTPAAIAMQPAAQSVPMGLPATFAVSATGTSLQYQWYRDGAAIPGATSSAYTTPATTFADTGSSFHVAVSNSASAVSSDTVSLTVTARAPMPGDLRFQLVDAPATVNGWGNVVGGIATDIPGRGAAWYSPSIGTPLWVGSAGDCAPPSAQGYSCAWMYSERPFAPTAGGALTYGYAGDFYDSFQSDLQTSVLGQGAVNPGGPQSVITSLDLEPANSLFGLSWMQPTPVTGASVMQGPVYLMEQNTVTVADLQAAVTLDGASGRVVTAVSNNGGLITYLAYGWQSDPSSVYEAKVVTASTPGAPAAAAALAGEGYIITAIGQADSSGNLLLVGTRVQGDTMARPFTTDAQTQRQNGYAVVGVIVNLSQPLNPYTFLGER